MIKTPKVVQGTKDYEGQAKYFVFGRGSNTEKDTIVDIPFSVGAETRTCFQSHFTDSMFIIRLELKGSGAEIACSLNGKAVKVNKNLDTAMVKKSGSSVRLEVPVSSLIEENVLQLSTKNQAEYFALYQI